MVLSTELPTWTYWRDLRTLPQAHRLCLETIQKHHPNLRVVTDVSFQKMWKPDTPIDLSSLKPQHRADYIRVYLLREFGGLWLDTDVIVLRPLQIFTSLLAQHEFVGYGFFHGEDRVTNAIMASLPRGEFINALFDFITARVRQGPIKQYTEIGPSAVQAIRRRISDPKKRRFLHHWRFQSVPYNKTDQFHRFRDDREHETHLNSNAFSYHLTSAALWPIAHESREALLASRRFIGFLWRRGLGLSEIQEKDLASHGTEGV